MAIICSNCGGPNYDENNVCIDCGFFVNGLPEGTLLDNRYQIKEAVKAGGMGAIYRAFDTRLQQDCAVKEMFNNAGHLAEQQDNIVKRFMKEAKLLAGLNHPSIPRVIDYFSEGKDKYYLVMDFIEGRDLYTYVFDEGGRGVKEELVTEWSIQVCHVLDYLHSQPQPILHRDLKPSNLILREKDSRVMLIDFGLARPVDPASRAQKTVVGTMGYAAIEQYQGMPEPRSDIYSLGATMHFFLTAQESMPFKFLPVTTIRADVSEWMEKIIQKALSFKAENRFASAREMYEVLIGDLSIEDLTFDPNDMSGLDMSIIDGDKPSKISSSGHSDTSDKLNRISKDRKTPPFRVVSKDRKPVRPLRNVFRPSHQQDSVKTLENVEMVFNDDITVEEFVKRIKNEDKSIKMNITSNLSKIGELRAVEILLKLYEDEENIEIRKEAREGLISIGNRRQVGDVLGFLLNIIDEDDNKYVELLPGNSNIYFQSVKELFLEFIKDRDRVNVRFHLGVIYYYYGSKDISMIHFERAYKLKKDQPEVLFFIGKIFHEKRELEKAIKFYENALKSDPSYTEAGDCLINVYYDMAQDDSQRGMFEEELEWYNKIISDFPENKETLYIKGLLAIKQKNLKDAKKYFFSYIKEKPSGKRITEAQNYFKELVKDDTFFKIKNFLGKFLRK